MRIPLGDVTASVVPDLATFPRTMPPDCSVTSSEEPIDGTKSARARAAPQSAAGLHGDMGTKPPARAGPMRANGQSGEILSRLYPDEGEFRKKSWGMLLACPWMHLRRASCQLAIWARRGMCSLPYAGERRKAAKGGRRKAEDEDGHAGSVPHESAALFLRGADFFFAGFFFAGFFLAAALVLRGGPLKTLSQPVEYLTFEPVWTV